MKSKEKPSKNFGPHVRGFYGSVNGGPRKPFIGVAPNDDGEFGEWLTPKQAEALIAQMQKALAYLKEPAT